MAATWDWGDGTENEYYWLAYVEASVSSTTGLITNDNFELYWYNLQDEGGMEGVIDSSNDVDDDFLSDHLGYTFLRAYLVGATDDDSTPHVMYATWGQKNGYDSGDWQLCSSRPYYSNTPSDEDAIWTGKIYAYGYSDEEKAALEEKYDPDGITDEDSFLEVLGEKITDYIDSVSRMTVTSQNTLNFKKAKAIDIEAKNISAFEAEEVKTASTAITVSTAMTTGY